MGPVKKKRAKADGRLIDIGQMFDMNQTDWKVGARTHLERRHRHGNEVIEEHETGVKEKSTQFTSRTNICYKTPIPALYNY